jgi:hypothetical protein
MAGLPEIAEWREEAEIDYSNRSLVRTDSRGRYRISCCLRRGNYWMVFLGAQQLRLAQIPQKYCIVLSS